MQQSHQLVLLPMRHLLLLLLIWHFKFSDETAWHCFLGCRQRDLALDGRGVARSAKFPFYLRLLRVQHRLHCRQGTDDIGGGVFLCLLCCLVLERRIRGC